MFTQRISMSCTQVQYEEHLKEELIRMGYKKVYLQNWKSNPYIVNNFLYILGDIGNTCLSNKHIGERIDLGEFNAPLFLARAAMTDEQYGGYGEYWKFTGETTTNWTNGKLYKANGSIQKSLPFIDDIGDSNGRVYPLGYFQKADVIDINNTFRKPIIKEMVTNAHLNQGKLSIIPPVMPIIVPYQLCPKCKGEGDLPAFYDPFGQSTTGTSFQRRQCDVCNGAKVIPMHVIK